MVSKGRTTILSFGSLPFSLTAIIPSRTEDMTWRERRSGFFDLTGLLPVLFLRRHLREVNRATSRFAQEKKSISFRAKKQTESILPSA